MSDYELLVKAIVDEMSKIIGPVAVAQANSVDGLKFGVKVVIKGNPQKVINDLICNYKALLGPVATTIAKRGVNALVEKYPKIKVPKELIGCD